MRMLNYTLLQSMHLKRQTRGFAITRDSVYCYLFLHFINPVEIINNGHLVQTSSNACYICTPGSPIYYKAEIIDLLHNFIHFEVDDPEEFARKGLPLNTVFYTDMQESITRDVEYMDWTRTSRQQPHLNRLNSVIDKFFDSLAAEQKKNKISLGQNSQVALDNLRSMIYISPADWNVESMANFVHLSRSHFSIKYKERFGISPNEDLTQAALLLATRYLTNSNMQVYDIAYECGFSSPEYFIRIFKTKKGITPGKFRETYRGFGGDASPEQSDVMPWETPEGKKAAERCRLTREDTQKENG